MKYLPAAIGVLVAGCLACNVKEQKFVPIIEKTETVCLGHHLFDLPRDFVPVVPIAAVFNPASANSGQSPIDVSVMAERVTPAAFAAAVSGRRSEILRLSHRSTDILKDSKTAQDSTLFQIQRIGESYTSELHFLKTNLHIAAELKSYEGRFREAEASLFAFEKNVLSTDQGARFGETGFCIGPVVVNGRNKEESVSVTFRSKERRDIVITIEVDSYSRNDPVTLLDRMSGPNSLLSIFDARNDVLRKRELKVAGMRAQEWLGSVKLGENRTKKQFGFALETMRASPSQAAPRIHIGMDSGQNDAHGNKHENSMSDEEATAFWDALVKSIRPRREAD